MLVLSPPKLARPVDRRMYLNERSLGPQSAIPEPGTAALLGMALPAVGIALPQL